jgi:hypothetical protein
VRTGAAGVSLVDDLKGSARLLAFVLQKPFEHAPCGIQHGLRHPCLHQLSTAHVAHGDLLILIYELAAELMQRILAPVRRSSM